MPRTAHIPFVRPVAIWMILATCLLALPAAAQPDIIRFRRFSDEEGLPNNLYRMALQDCDGLIWMAGMDGLASYDGYEVRSFRHSHQDTQSISGNNVNTLYEDNTGRLWVGTLGAGLCYSDVRKRTFTRVHLSSQMATDGLTTVYAITSDSLGHVWVGTDAGLWILRAGEGGFTLHPPADTLTTALAPVRLPQITALFTDRYGRVLIGTREGLYVADPARRTFRTPDYFSELPPTAIHDFTVDRTGRIWLSCAKSDPRLFVSDPQELRFSPFDGIPIRFEPSEVRMAVDQDNRLWVGSFGEQAFAFDLVRDTLIFQSKVNSEIRHERFFRKPFVNHSGDVWLPCEGFYILPYPKGFHTYRHPFAFHQSNTFVYEDENDRWIGYREQGILRIHRHAERVDHLSSSQAPPFYIPTNHVQDVLRLSSGRYVLISLGVVTILREDGQFLRSHPVGGSNRAVYEDRQQRIWIGGYDGLHLFDERRGVVRTYALPPSLGDARNFIQAIQEDDRGQIWFGSDLKGLAVLNPATGQIDQLTPVAGDSTSLPSLSVIDMSADGSGHFWLATDVGLVRLEPGTRRMRLYDHRHGIDNDYIAAVQCTPDGRTWVSTHAGLAVFDPVAERFTNYGQGDGLSNASYYPRSKFLSADGTLFFGGIRGVDYFHPDRLRKNPAVPRMVLTELRVNQQPVAAIPEGGLDLSHRDKLIEIAMAGLHYTDQAGVRYAYRVDGIHTDWVDLGAQRHVVFAALPPGDYRFRARAVSGDDVPSAEELSVPFVIRPPFYGTAWFRLLILLLVAAAVLAWVRVREQRIRAQDRREVEINRKMSELEKRALQSQMNPHFIYNSMNSIQQFMLEHDVEGAMKYLTRFSRILRTVLNLSAQSRVPLADEIKMIEDYLELENMRFPDKFTYAIDVDPAINIHAVEIPPFFIQPQVENAIRHGLLRKPTPGHLHIHLYPDGQELRIRVEDNGIGRQAANRLKMREGSVDDSKGLAIVQERLSHLHAGNGHDTFTITDLYDADGQPDGTRVEIRLPLD